MSHAVLSHSVQPQSSTVSGTRVFVTFVLVAWLALIFLLGSREVFVAPRGTPPLPILTALAVPIIVFLVVFWVSNSFREYVLTADLRFMTGMQAWRFGGFAFLALMTYNVLPGYFARPAGLGDMAIGITAPWIILALIRQPSFAASKAFVAWNVFGLLDLVVAVSLGAFGPRLFASGAVGAVKTSPMAYLPLVLVPAYLVPMFIILHVTALFQARRFAGQLRGDR